MTSWPSHPSMAALLDPVGSVMNGILRDALGEPASRISSGHDALVLGRFAELLEHLPAALVAYAASAA
jgi:hypothetical protein